MLYQALYFSDFSWKSDFFGVDRGHFCKWPKNAKIFCTIYRGGGGMVPGPQESYATQTEGTRLPSREDFYQASIAACASCICACLRVCAMLCATLSVRVYSASTSTLVMLCLEGKLISYACSGARGLYAWEQWEQDGPCHVH